MPKSKPGFLEMLFRKREGEMPGCDNVVGDEFRESRVQLGEKKSKIRSGKYVSFSPSRRRQGVPPNIRSTRTIYSHIYLFVPNLLKISFLKIQTPGSAQIFSF